MKPNRLLFIIPALPILSAFLWAAFDIKWWVPTDNGGRDIVLFLMHMIAMVFGFIISGFKNSDLFE